MSLEKKKPKTSSLLDQWKKKKKTLSSDSAISTRPKENAPIPSKGQQRLWLLQQLYPENSFYQYGHLYTIRGLLDLELFKQSFQLLIDRHEILRTNFIKKETGLFLKINPTVNFSCNVFDLSQCAPKEQKEKSDYYIWKESNKTFDLAEDLLIRVSILQFSANKFQVILSIHHIIGDRWSLRLLNEELFSFYKNLKSKEPIKEQALNIQYADYAYWQQNQKTKPGDLNYWKDHLAGDLPILNIPGDFKRPQRPSFKGQNIKKTLNADLSKKLQQLAKDKEVTMFALMLSAFKVLLYRYTNQEDLIIGSPFSNRDKRELEKLIGFFNETLVLRTQLEKDWTFEQLIKAVKKTTLKAFEHKAVPFDELVSALKVERHGSANPVFQAMFLYNSALPFSIPDLDLEVEEAIIDLKVSKFDLTLFVTDQQKQLELSLEFSLDLFKKETAKRLLQHFEVLLESIAKDTSIPLNKIPLLPPQEANQILIDWNQTTVAYPEYSSIHQLIEEQAKRYPDRIAVTFQNDVLSYRDLNTQANAIAKKLIKAGIQANQSVGLYANRSTELMVSILGILKAGAAYLPLDPEYPAERIDFMIQDSGTTLVLSQKKLIEKLNIQNVSILSIEDSIQQDDSKNWSPPVGNPEHLAYTIYTSGSTGKPKGVPIRHKNLLHSTLSRFTFYPSNPEAFLLLSSFSFDSSIVGIFWTLCSGGTLVLPPKRIEQDVIQLCNLIAKHQVSHTLMLPSLYSAVLNHAPTEQIHTLKNVMVAGEACPFPLIDKHYDRLPNTDLYNEYGPTEASVWCIAHKILPDEKHFVPIGKAIPNTEVYILNSALQASPIGIPGELHIGGLGLAEGYLNRPELTQEKFIPHPFKTGARLYKTGDLARFHTDGRIEFLGRVDHQVKIRGFRVEPGEIQKRILEYESVDEALVLVHQSGSENQKRLIAYASRIAASEISKLRLFLEDQLPAYMIPSAIIPLEDFPRLPNGKINRKGLPDPDLFTTISGVDYIAPKSATEIQLAKIWKAVLHLDSVGVRDNFFALGGDSILSIQVVSKARDLGIFLAPNQLFEHQTIEALANSIDETALTVSENNPVILPENNPTNFPLSSLQKAFLFNSESNEKDQGLLQLEFTIAGIIDFDFFKKAWQQSSKRHDAMRAFIQQEPGQQAIQVIAPEHTLDWEFLDWKNLSESEQASALEQLRYSDQQKELDLKKAPISRMYFIQLAADKQLLFWTCHHIFLDGWSCGIILKDALTFYNAIQKKAPLNLAPIPNFLAYLDWKTNADHTAEQKFWNNLLAGFEKPLTFKNNSNKPAKFEDEFLKLSLSESLSLEKFCQQNSISISTLFQGLWALLLGKLSGQSDVVYGLTVSGRFVNFPHIESTSGLFMNVIPNRFKIKQNQSFAEWLGDLQKAQGKISQFESTPLETIKSTINWPNHLALFDTLFVFGNFLKDGLKIGNLEVEHFQGGFSSSYPLTMRINPLQQIELDWRYDTSKINSNQISWIKQSFYKMIKQIAQEGSSFLIKKMIATLSNDITFETIQKTSENAYSNKAYTAPRNQLELDLTNIWESIFNRKNIGIKDNFFEIGGKSLMAIQLFSEIEKELDCILPPSILFQHPTIEALANVIETDQTEDQKDQTLIPLRATGSKPPLFCIHGGGAHVFFYKKMASYLSEDQPVYSFQPPGLNGQNEFPKSIEAMASQYIETLKTVQQEGPYHLLGTCFSNAVVLEMARQLQSQGDELEKLFIIDSAPVHLFGNDEDGKSKTFSRFFDMLKRGDFHRIQTKIIRRFQKKEQVEKPVVESESSSEKQLRRTIEMLNKLYADYHWKAFDGKIHFIRSSEFQNRPDKNYHLTQWKKLAKNGVTLEVVPGHHLTLFEDPEVKGLAHKIEECIQVKST